MDSAGEAFGDSVSVVPGRLWSLGEMINRRIFPICELLMRLTFEEVMLEQWMRPGTLPAEALHVPASKEIVTRIAAIFGFANNLAMQFEIRAARDRITRFDQKSRHPMRIDEVLAEVKALKEAVQDGLNYRYFYYYPYDKALELIAFEKKWEPVYSSFKSAKDDAKAAVDCWALGHGTASVFHFMRVAEIGLRALARERRITIKRKPLEWANWQDIRTPPRSTRGAGWRWQ